MTMQRGTDTAAIHDELAEVLNRAAGLAPEVIAEAGESPLAELGLESLAAMELQAAIEDRYQVKIPDEPWEMSFAEIARYVIARIEEGS